MEPVDWVERSNREAAALVAELGQIGCRPSALVALLAEAYRTGALDGMQRAQEIMNEAAR